MSNDIPFSLERGIDPHICICPRCGQDNGELTLGVLMKAEYQGVTHYTPRGTTRKYERNNKLHHLKWQEIKDSLEKIPGSICKDCNQLQENANEMVKQGGIFFRCLECGAEGAIKADHPMSRAVRNQTGIQSPDPVGMELDHCDQHGGKNGHTS